MQTSKQPYWRHLLGASSENTALSHLKKQGLKLVCRNFRCKAGEIDLVMCQGRQLIFVEVRYRSRSDYGGAVASVTLAKQRKIIRTAAYFLQLHRQYRDFGCRFDVVAITGKAPDKPCINWIPNAFY